MQQDDRARKEVRSSCGIAERNREPWLLSDPCNSRNFEGRRLRMMMMMIMATMTMVTLHTKEGQGGGGGGGGGGGQG